MKNRLIYSTIAILVLCCGVDTNADESPNVPVPNAALKYWQAFGALPGVNERMSTKLRQVWDPETFSKPPGDGLTRQIQAADYSLRVLHHAAAIEECDWGIDMRAEGAETILPHLHEARTLSLLALLRARVRFAAGETNDAVGDLIATATLGRHITQDGTIIGVLLGYQIEERAYGVLCGWLRQLDNQALNLLRQSLDRLPPQASVADAVASEEQFLDWALQLAESEQPGSLLRLCRSLTSSDEEAEAVLVAGGRRGEFVRYLRATRPFYEEAQRIVELMPDDFAERHVDYLRRIDRNPVAKFCTANLSSLNRVVHRNRVHQGLIRAAIDVQQAGIRALVDHSDPFGDGPYEHTVHPGGFTLTSAYKVADHDAVVMSVGIRE